MDPAKPEAAFAPLDALAHAQAGVESARRDDWMRSVAHFRVAVAAAPHVAEGWVNLSSALQRVGNLEGAERTARQALALQPALAGAWNTLGLVALDRARFAEAREHFTRAVQADPMNAQARMNLGIAEHREARDGDAFASLRRALELDPALSAAHYNLGALHHRRGELHEAMQHYRKATALRPDDAQSHFNLSLALLLLGRFEEAWPAYAWRSQRRENAAVLRHEGRSRVALHAEQGLGDNLFFLRFAARLREAGITLDFVGDERLHAMLARTGLFASTLQRLADLPDGERDVVLTGDLPSLIPGAAATVPPPLALIADPSRLESARRRLAGLGPAPHVAVAWRAGEPKSGRIENLFKEVPIDALGAALRGMGATVIAIQRDPRAGEIEALAQASGAPVHDLTGVNADLEEALALLAAIDEYVGVSSTLVHLRAGLGASARILVPFPPEWRWMDSGDTSPWFPQARIYRQAPDGDWSAALARLRSDFAATRS